MLKTTDVTEDFLVGYLMACRDYKHGYLPHIMELYNRTHDYQEGYDYFWSNK